MPMAPHKILIALGACALPLLSTPVLDGRDTDPPGAQDPNSAASCGKCHTQIFKEWKGRAHAKAWVDDLFQAQLKEKKNKAACTRCHIPLPIHTKLGKRPKARESLLDEGVHCIACHQSKDGDKIVGPFGAKTDAHASIKGDAFTTREGQLNLCYSCHGSKITPVLPLAKDYKTVYLPDPEAPTCIECHMPEVERPLAIDPETKQPTGPARKGRRHALLGPRDSAFCAKAFELTARKEGDNVVLAIENKAGHRIPGLTKLRKFVVHIAQQDGEGKELSRHKVELWWDKASGSEGLWADAARRTRTFPFARAKDAAQIEVTIDHVMLDEKINEVMKKTLGI